MSRIAASPEQNAATPRANNTLSVYRPLDSASKEIRILHISPDLSEPEGLLCCRLEHVSLLSDPAPNYEATSWCWGTSIERQRIFLDGRSVCIPRNAEVVLRDMCFEQKHYVVWLDAVCINQADTAERGSQVAIMKDVYSIAQNVLVWLGADEVGLAQPAFAAIDKITEEAPSLYEHFRTVGPDRRKDIMLDYFARDELSNQPLPECDWKALRSFYALPWFSRLWVVQEVVLSQQAVCFLGTLSRSWSTVGEAASWMRRCQYWNLDYFRALGGHLSGIDHASAIRSQASRDASSLTELLQLSINLQATNPLDKVYGIFGLMRRLDESNPSLTASLANLAPDYTRSRKDLYTAATRAAFEEKTIYAGQTPFSLAPALLDTSSDGGEDGQEWPSWVPRYDQTWDHDLSSPEPMAMGYSKSACLGAVSIVEWPISQPDEISVKGLMVDNVSQHGQTLSAALLNDRRALCDEINFCFKIARSAGSSSTQFAMTLTQARDEKRYYASKNETFSGDYEHFMQECRVSVNSSESQSVHFSEEGERYRNAVVQNCKKRKFFCTSTGRIGVGHPRLLENDVVCILYGNRNPYILRRKDDCWRLVGDAWVYGIMEGEFIRQLGTPERLRQEEQWFNIR